MRFRPGSLIGYVLFSLTFVAACNDKTVTPNSPGTSTLNASPIAATSSPIKVGTIRHKVNPLYPPAAKGAHIEGQVVLHAIIAADGTIESLEPLSGPALLQGAAVQAVKQWVYEPYLVNGQPRRVDTTVTVNFKLTPSQSRSH